MKDLIVITAVGRDRPGVVQQLTQRILDCGGNIIDSRMTTLGQDLAILMLVSGSWHTMGRLESELNKAAEKTDLTISIRRTEARPAREDMVPYAVDVVCLDQPGIVHNLVEFFESHGIEIAELNTRSYAAAHTGAPMFSVQMAISIPGRLHIGTLREEFMEFGDRMNLDAIIEPVKG